jgi:hypothetical protein
MFPIDPSIGGCPDPFNLPLPPSLRTDGMAKQAQNIHPCQMEQCQSTRFNDQTAASGVRVVELGSTEFLLALWRALILGHREVKAALRRRR